MANTSTNNCVLAPILNLKHPSESLGVLILAARVRSRASRFVHSVHFSPFFAPNFVNNYHLTFAHKCGIILLSRGEHKTERQGTVDRQIRYFQGQCALTRLGWYRIQFC